MIAFALTQQTFAKTRKVAHVLSSLFMPILLDRSGRAVCERADTPLPAGRQHYGSTARPIFMSSSVRPSPASSRLLPLPARASRQAKAARKWISIRAS